MDRVLPEWERIRLLPHASVIHRFTVDRHLVETCIEASALIRHVGRPDVLMVAALLHDIGKGELTEHSVAGEPIARAIATRMGFDERSVDLIGTLVRWHLLLAETASARDPDDPATVRRVTERVPDLEALNLLRALTESDARATAPKAWSSVAGQPDRHRRAAGRPGAGRRPGRGPGQADVGRGRGAQGGPQGRHVHRRRAPRGRRPGDGDRPRPPRPAGGRGGAVRDPAGVGTGGPRLEPGRRGRVRLGHRRRPPRRGRAAPAVRGDRRREARSGRAAASYPRRGPRPDRRGPPRGVVPVDRARGTGRRPHRGPLPGLCGPRRPGPLRPLRPRRHPRPPGRRRLLRAGGGRRRPRRPPRLPGRPRRPRGAVGDG